MVLTSFSSENHSTISSQKHFAFTKMFTSTFIVLALATVALASPAPVSPVDVLNKRSVVNCADPIQNPILIEACLHS